MCDVDAEGVISCADAPSIYDIPKVLHREGLDAYVVRRLGLPFRDVDWTVWGDLLDRVHSPKQTVTVALVGKYIDLPDAYLSVTEALRAGGFAHRSRVQIRWVPSDDCETPEGAEKALAGVDGVCVPGGFGVRGIEGKLGALRYTRTNGIPTLGLCLGLQCMVIEYARDVAGLEKANSAEFDPDTPDAGHRHHGQPGRRRRRRARTWAARCGWAATRPACRRARSPPAAYGSTDDHRAAPAPLRGGQRLPRPAQRGRAWCSPAPRPTGCWSSSPSCPARCTRSSSARRPTPS